jgi:hypothetical protein
VRKTEKRITVIRANPRSVSSSPALRITPRILSIHRPIRPPPDQLSMFRMNTWVFSLYRR